MNVLCINLYRILDFTGYPCYYLKKISGVINTEYPVFLKRKRYGTLIFNAVMLAVSLASMIYNIANGGEYAVFIVTSAVFAVTLAFNIFINTEKTYAIYEDRIVSLSKFLPKTEIRACEIAGVDFANELHDTLKINYNTDEFDIEKISGGRAAFAELGEGMWTAYISKRDVDRPLEEVKYIIESMKK